MKVFDRLKEPVSVQSVDVAGIAVDEHLKRSIIAVGMFVIKSEGEPFGLNFHSWKAGINFKAWKFRDVVHEHPHTGCHE